MKRSRFESFGIGQNVRREWMDRALQLAIEGKGVEECRSILTDVVLGIDTGRGMRGKESAKKAVQLLRVWFAPIEEMSVFVEQLKKWAAECPVEEIVCLHWAVLAGTFPFFFEVCSVLGRLFALQGKATKAQVLSRCEERYGVTPTAARNLEYALWMLVNFGMLKTGTEKGEYLPPEKAAVDREYTAMLIWKAALHATQGGNLSVSRLRHNPAFFPFELPSVTALQMSEAFCDIDVASYVGVDDQLFLKGMVKQN